MEPAPIPGSGQFTQIGICRETIKQGSIERQLIGQQMRRQGIELGLVDHELQLGRRLMPPGVVVGGDLLEAHVQVEGRSDPFQGVDGAVAVVNFVGRSVDCRKTDKNKRIILESRVKSCRVLGQAMAAVRRPPPVWIQSATAHIVGDPEPKDTICDEATPPGPLDEMAPHVGVVWERA